MLSYANAKQCLCKAMLYSNWDGSEGWQQSQQEKVVPIDTAGFAQHLKIWIIEFMDDPKQVVNFTYKKEGVKKKNYKVWAIDCSDGNISNFVWKIETLTFLKPLSAFSVVFFSPYCFGNGLEKWKIIFDFEKMGT